MHRERFITGQAGHEMGQDDQGRPERSTERRRLLAGIMALGALLAVVGFIWAGHIVPVLI